MHSRNIYLNYRNGRLGSDIDKYGAATRIKIIIFEFNNLRASEQSTLSKRFLLYQFNRCSSIYFFLVKIVFVLDFEHSLEMHLSQENYFHFFVKSFSLKINEKNFITRL